jgi:hypothetical protein
MTRMKKTIAILLAVLFLVTVTAGAVSAVDTTKNTKLFTGYGVKTSKDPKAVQFKDLLDDTSQGTIMATFTPSFIRVVNTN